MVKKEVPVHEKLLELIKSREPDEDGFRGSINTMARRKVKRKVKLFDVLTGIESQEVLSFEDLRPGDVFHLYDYNDKEVLCSGIKTLIVDSISRKIDGRIGLDILPYTPHDGWSNDWVL